MLNLKSRSDYKTLLDAHIFEDPNTEETALVFYHDRDTFERFSRADFAAQTDLWRERLRENGISAGDLIAIAHGQRPETVFAFWGALQLGAIPSLFAPLTEKLDPDIYFDRLRRLAVFAQPRVLLMTAAQADRLENFPCPVVPLEEVSKVPPSSGTSHSEKWATPDPHAIAFLQHSSGTTGLQKGVALTHQAVLNQLAAVTDALALTSADTFVSWLPLYHDMGLIAGFLLPLMQGVPLVLLDPLEWARRPVGLLEAITKFSATRCWLPNFAYNHLARRVRRGSLGGLDLSSMRQFINCSEPVKPDSHRLFLEKFSPLGVTPIMLGASYAMAENTFAVTQTKPDKPPAVFSVDRQALQRDATVKLVPSNDPLAISLASSGRPIPQTVVKIVNSAGLSLHEGNVGEIFIQSNCLLHGYYRRPELASLTEGWYATGDVGFILDGELCVIGRKKEIIIYAGKNIFPQDIEAVVNDVPGVAPGRCAAFGVFDPKEGTELIAVVAEPEPGVAQADFGPIKKEIRQRVGRHTQVTLAYADIVPPRWLIKTSSGKIARDANRQKWLKEKAVKAPFSNHRKDR